MSLRRRTLRGALSLSVGQAIGQALSFVRNIIIARMLTPEDFGIAATFVITITLFERMSDMAVDRMLIQAQDGDSPRLQGTAHAFTVVRGAVNGLILLVVAWPAAYLFHVLDALWAFLALAAWPILRGFAHLDVQRFQRELNYSPGVLTEVGSQFVLTLICIPLAAWLRSYAVMVWVILGRAMLQSALSHVLAERPYEWFWDRAYARRLFVFGWPLMINGVLMYAILQGDRFAVASCYTLTELGLYSAVYSLLMSPSMLIGRLATSLFLPLLARVQGDTVRFSARYRLCVSALAVAAGTLAIPVLTAGTPLLLLLYGYKYEAASSIFTWLAVMQAIRVFRYAPTVGALALADTANSAIANAYRLLGVGAALVAALLHAKLEWIAVAGAAGELLATFVAALRLRRRRSVRLTDTFVAPALVSIVLCAAAATNWSGPLSTTLPFRIIVGCVLVTLTPLLLFVVMPDFRREVTNVWSTLLQSVATKATRRSI